MKSGQEACVWETSSPPSRGSGFPTARLLRRRFTRTCRHTCIELFCTLFSNFLVNSADRVIRVFDIEDILREEDGDVEALQRLQDLVNRYVRGRGVCIICR